MEGSAFDHDLFFRAVSRSDARALLIGRQALIVLGLPVVTRDYDFWVHIDDIDAFNELAEPFDLFPNRSPEQARQVGRYVLQNDEHVDVLVSRAVPTVDGTRVSFDELWAQRQSIEVARGVTIFIPSIEGLILTKRFGERPKDAEDIRMLRVLQKGGER